MAHVPVSDADLLRVRLIDLALSVWMVAVYCALPFAYLAWRFGLSPLDCTGAVALWCLDVFGFAAAVVVACSYSPVARHWRISLIFGGLTLLIGGIFVGFSIRWLSAPP